MNLMTLDELFKDKNLKTKEKTEMLAQWLSDGSLPADELLAFAEKAKEGVKATCIEAMEYVTKQNPAWADVAVLDFVTGALADKAPRIKWEAARVIGNTAKLFPANLEKAVDALLANTEHEGTVVRWSAAYALGEIIKLKTPLNAGLIPAAEAVCTREEKNSIRKIYLEALKKAQKEF